MSILITVEGLDFMGKSTLVQSLINKMSDDGSFANWTYPSKEPGSRWSGKVAGQLREMVLQTPDLKPLERELLFYVDASLHKRFIDNQDNAIIISDRGLWSHMAYLRGYLKEGLIDHDVYSLCRSLISTVCAKPDCVVYLKGDLDLMKVRSFNKPKDAIERNSEGFFTAVLETYEDLVRDATWRKDKLLILEAINKSDENVDLVINYLKGAFTNEELRTGNRELH